MNSLSIKYGDNVAVDIKNTNKEVKQSYSNVNITSSSTPQEIASFVADKLTDAINKQLKSRAEEK